MAAGDQFRAESETAGYRSLSLAAAAALSADDVLRRLETVAGGLSPEQAGVRLVEVGPNSTLLVC